MKFVLEVDLTAFDGTATTELDGTATKELERILRYWGGNMRHYQLVPGDNSVIYDSAYREVGRWSITATDEVAAATDEVAAATDEVAAATDEPSP